MARYRPLKLLNFIRHEQGATAIEFAIIGNVFFLLSMGIMEFGLVNYMKVAVQSTAINAARYTAIGNFAPGCTDMACSVKKYIDESTLGFIGNSEGALVNVEATVLGSPTDAAPQKPDMCLASGFEPYSDTCGAGNRGPFVDNNANNQYDSEATIAMSLGNPGDLVEIRITYLWKTLFPMMSKFFVENTKRIRNSDSAVIERTQEGYIAITSTVVFRNEPAP